jgi:hypothetical protein
VERTPRIERKPSLKKIIVAVGMAACLVPFVALAAKPAKNSAFQYCTKPNKCPFGFETNKRGGKIVDIKLYTKCNEVPATFEKIKVKKGGKFANASTATNVIGQKITYSIAGQFVKKGKAVGTYDVDRKGCSDKPVKFTAKRTGKAQSGF